MLNFISQYWLYITIVAFVAGYAIYLVVTKNWPGLRVFAYAIMLQAERIYKDNEGEKKFHLLFETVYEKFPLMFFVFNEDIVKAKLQKLYERAKDFLDDGIINDSDAPPPGRTR